MDYLMTFLEGIITFISPCILPMLPIYISYFMGQDNTKNEKLNVKALINSLGFVLGFTTVFTILGVLSASFGILVREYIRYVNIIFGIIIVVFGINLMGIITIPWLNNVKGINVKINRFTFVSSYIFGIIFGATWSPCIGAFLGTALSIIAVNGNIIKGIILILIYCLGLGVPLMVSTILIDKLKNSFNYIKSHYKVINLVCGMFLCIIGILMITGLIDKYFELIG